MPEGDTIYRAAATLARALTGRTVTSFESVLPALTRVHEDQPITGRSVDRVWPAGKHLLIAFSGGLVLRTHMRMHGSWHLYRPGERWRRGRSHMRIAIATDAYVAVAFDVPVAELLPADLRRVPSLAQLGPDVLADDFDVEHAAAALRARPHLAIGDALLDQHAVAGIGNIYKSEACFAAAIHPFTPVAKLSHESLRGVLDAARRLMRANASGPSAGGIVTYRSLRGTTGHARRADRVFVYGRRGRPCRRCGAPIRAQKTGPHARITYWCDVCQR